MVLFSIIKYYTIHNVVYNPVILTVYILSCSSVSLAADVTDTVTLCVTLHVTFNVTLSVTLNVTR